MHLPLSLLALAALLIFTTPTLTVPAYSAFRAHKHQHQRRQTLGSSITIPTNQIRILQQYATTYHGWITAWMQMQPAGSPAIIQLEQQYMQFEGWVDEWIALAMGSSSAGGILPGVAAGVGTGGNIVTPAAPVARTQASAISTSLQAGPALAQLENVASPTSAAPLASTPAEPATPATGGSAAAAPAAPGATFQKQQTAVVALAPLTLTKSPTHKPLAPSIPRPPTSPPVRPTFNAKSPSNIAVYWGSGDLGTAIPLSQLCTDASVNIIVLAFLTGYTDKGGYPTIDFAKGCEGQTEVQKAKGASGLKRCDLLAQGIQTCQANGRKVLLSIGGAGAEGAPPKIDFASDGEAKKAAALLWDLFGGGGKNVEKGLRPFGDVKVDGFDIDAENKRPAHYTTFVLALRGLMASSPRTPSYISSAPQCPRPDASIPLEAMQIMDFVFVQFYNNPACNLDSPGFGASFRAWSEDMAKGPNGGPRVFVGAPGCPTPKCSGSAYVESGKLWSVVGGAKAAKNMGGVMLWDGSRAKNNGDYLKAAKAAVS